MTSDEPDEQLAPPTPADEARLRALLADVRATGPMPPEVADRLDQVVVGLAADRSAGRRQPAVASEYETNLRPLIRTRRHRVVAVLGAAAAVAVVALGVSTFLDREPDAVTDAGSADTGVERGAVDEPEVAKSGPAEMGTEADAPQDAASDPVWVMRIHTDRGPFIVHSRHVTRDLARIQHALLPSPGAARYGKTTIHEPTGFSCPTASWGRGILAAAKYDGDPVYVAFRQPMGESQVVEVLQCGTGDLLRSTTLPVEP